MTTNNEVKAPRPCTLWGKTFDSNTVTSFTLFSNRLSVCCELVYRPTRPETLTNKEALLEAIQAIASAQRPWLKGEGFEFVDGSYYRILTKNFEEHIDTVYNATCSSYVLAFKPISDSQEAWDAVAGVEVAEGV